MALQTSCHVTAMSSRFQTLIKKITETIPQVCYGITPHQILIQHNLQHKIIYTTCGTITKQLAQPSQQ